MRNKREAREVPMMFRVESLELRTRIGRRLRRGPSSGSRNSRAVSPTQMESHHTLTGRFCDSVTSALTENELMASNGGSAALWLTDRLRMIQRQQMQHQSRVFLLLATLPSPCIGKASVDTQFLYANCSESHVLEPSFPHCMQKLNCIPQTELYWPQAVPLIEGSACSQALPCSKQSWLLVKHSSLFLKFSS
jgi:hypothetical protein